MITAEAAAVPRGEGITPSERKLAELGERTFLNLWSYPNTFIDRKQHGKGAGNEFCDLLIVCGDDVILFSDKSVAWPGGVDLDLAWSRWYRRAVEKSVNQIRGAASWLAKHPDRIFLDKECTRRLPIELPPPHRMRIHGIAVAVGANEACRAFFNDNVGTFAVQPALKDRDHINKEHPSYMPFALGDADTQGPFVHVFDERSLDILLFELDTISDFVEYLTKRARLIREERLLFSPGEEDLVAHYLKRVGPDGSHDFTIEPGKLVKAGEAIALADGTYEAFINDPQYRAKREANAISYAWDALINSFTKHMLAGTSISLDDEPPQGMAAEPGVRILALANRVQRRLFSLSVQDAVQKSLTAGVNRYFRILFPGTNIEKADTAYVILLLLYEDFYEELGGYSAYRQMRGGLLQAYCLSVKYKYPNLKQVVGIGLDMPNADTSKKGGSEDLVAVGHVEWTDEMVNYVLEARKNLGIMTKEPTKFFGGSVDEYPEVGASPLGQGVLTRQQRRALERKQKKRQPGRGGGRR